MLDARLLELLVKLGDVLSAGLIVSLFDVFIQLKVFYFGTVFLKVLYHI